MKISGFSFVKNAIELDYPVAEAIQSVLPLVDEMIVAVGQSVDGSQDLIASLGEKIRIVDTHWDESVRHGGRVLAMETNRAFAQIDEDADWCLYIQADECIHEKYHEPIRAAMTKYLNDERVEGLLFGFKHFYGSFDFIGDSRTWYRNEIRIIRNDKNIRSWKDAQGFRLQERKLHVKTIAAEVYHYGWVRHPKFMMAKSLEANKYWHDDRWIDKRFDPSKDFDYSQIDSIERFTGTHPEVMQKRIEAKNWHFEGDPKVKRFGIKTGLLYYLEKLTGWRVGENKNYILID